MIAMAFQGWGALAAAWLLTYLVHSTLLLGLAWAVARVLRNRPAVDEAVWKAALVGGVLTATLQAGLGLESVSGAWHLDAAEAPRVIPTGDGGSLASATALSGREQPPSPAELDAAVELDDAAIGAWVVEPSAAPTEVSAVVPAATVASETPRSTTRNGAWSVWLLGAWALGTVVGLVGLARAWIGLRRRLRGRESVVDGPLCDMLGALRRRSGFRGAVRLSVGEGIGVPMAVGLRRAEICVPRRAVEALDPTEQRSMLAHELAHVVRRDPAWRLIATVFERVLFLQPLNRLASRELEACSEFLCDAWAAAHTDQPLALAQCLAEVAGWLRPHARLAPVPTMPAPRSILARRITRLVDPPHDFAQVVAPRWLPLGLAAVLAIAVVAAPGVSSGHDVVYGGDDHEVVIVDELEADIALPGYMAAVHVVPRIDHGHSGHEHDADDDEADSDDEPSRAERRRIRKERREAKKRVRKAFRAAGKKGRARPSDRALLRAAHGSDDDDRDRVEVDAESGVVIVIKSEDGSVRVMRRPHDHGRHARTHRERDAKQRARAHAARARAHAERARAHAERARAHAERAHRRAAEARERALRHYRSQAVAPSGHAPPMPPGFDARVQREVERAIRQAHSERQRAHAQLQRQLEQMQRSRRDAEAPRRQLQHRREAPRPPQPPSPPGHFEIRGPAPAPPAAPSV